MHKDNRLSRTFLSTGRIGILIRLPAYILEIFNIRPQNFPIEARILDPNLAMGKLRQMFGNLAAPCELDQSEIGILYYVFHGGVAAVDEVYIGCWHPAGLGEEEELLHYD